MIGIVKYWNASSRFGVIYGQDSDSYYVRQGSLRPNEFGERFLVEGEEVAFEVGEKRGRMTSATNVIPDRLKVPPDVPQGLRWEFIVVQMFSVNCSGVAVRPGAHDWFGWRRKGIVSQLPQDFRIVVGTRFWAGIKRSENDPERFHLREIEVFITDDGERKAAICEAPAMARETAASAEVL